MRVLVGVIPHNPYNPDRPLSAPETLHASGGDAAAQAQPSAGAGDALELAFERLYEENFDLLVGIAARKFSVPDVDAEALAQEVFLTYLKRRHEVREVHGWMIGAICHASRYYWRQNGRNIEQLDDERHAEKADPQSARIFDVLPARVAAREALEGLSPRYQEILRLRYYEGYSIQEIAMRLGVTEKYTQKLVMKCLRKAEQTFIEDGGTTMRKKRR